jgi:signal transduction histidine kinase
VEKGVSRPGHPAALQRYVAALARFAENPDEDGRAEAYALGRSAISEGLGVLDLARFHAVALDGLPDAESRKRAGEFLAEALGPFEMALRGFRDANTSLKQLTATLEERIAARTAELEGTERTLRERTGVLQGILDSMSDGVAVADGEGRFVLLNRAGEQIVGAGALQLFLPDETTPVADADTPLARALRGEEVRGLELFARNQAFQEGVHLGIAASPLVAPGGGAGAVLVLRNISQRRRAEEAERRAEERLRQSQKMDAIGQLAGGVAHDFNNLLAVIISYAELATMELPAEHSAVQDLGQISKAAESAAGLTRQLLAFSRRQVLQPTILDLNSAISDVERMLRRTIGEHIILATHLDPELRKVVADRGQVEQIVMNLAVNARDAMPSGGKLMIETANVEVARAAVSENDDAAVGYSVMAVTDTGIGMDAATRARIFEPFFTTKDVGKGTGLGLATVYGIVRQSGGHIWVYSEPGLGTTFKIYFPHARPAEEGDPAPAEVRRTTGTETVLLVEDAEALRAVAGRILRDSGYQVLEAQHPADARRLAAAHAAPIHLLLTDVVMPGSSGPELANALVPMHPGMRVLYMSGYASAGVVHGGALPPQVEFLEKPFTPEQLRARVRAVLDQGDT